MMGFNKKDLPADTHPDAVKALNYLDLFMNEEADPKSKKGDFERGFTLINRLMGDHKYEPSVPFIFSLFIYLKGNPESAAFFTARALLQKPDFPIARKALPFYLKSVGAREDPEEYLHFANRGTWECIRAYWELGRDHFEKGDLAMADHYVQRANALRYPRDCKPPDYGSVMTAMKKHVAEGTYDVEIEKWWATRKEYFPPASEDDARQNYEKWLRDPNKHQVARIAARLLLMGRRKPPVCVELGCHMGALMHLIRDKAKQWGVEADMVGIEPDPNPVALGRRQFPELTYHEGNHDDMVSRKVRLPESISVLLMSYTLFFMRSEMVEDVIRFAGGCCDHIVILDDLSNMEGEFAIPRRFYLLHPFRAILERHGLAIKAVTYADEPDLGVNGILEAENLSLAHA